MCLGLVWRCYCRAAVLLTGFFLGLLTGLQIGLYYGDAVRELEIQELQQDLKRQKKLGQCVVHQWNPTPAPKP